MKWIGFALLATATPVGAMTYDECVLAQAKAIEIAKAIDSAIVEAQKPFDSAKKARGPEWDRVKRAAASVHGDATMEWLSYKAAIADYCPTLR